MPHRILVRAREVPPLLVTSLMAIEDKDFATHHGISIRGILRAMWVNVKSGSMEQGGSTLTQQLVKNYFLNRERTLGRKLLEAVMAVVLEMRYSKEEILDIYPRVKGIQVMDDEGAYMFDGYRGQWIADTPARRKAIIERFRGQTVVMSQNEIHPRARLKTVGMV